MGFTKELEAPHTDCIHAVQSIVLAYSTCNPALVWPLPFISRCVLASVLEGASVRPSVGPSVGPSHMSGISKK